jgi:hypothetical protein
MSTQTSISTPTNMGKTETRQADQADQLVRFEPWTEPHFTQWGFAARSSYAETFWLPVLGPSSLVLACSVTAGFDTQHGAFEITIDDQAAAIGLSPGQLRRVIERLISFGLAKRTPAAVVLRTHWPVIERGALHQLPAPLRRLHGDWFLLCDALNPDDVTNRCLWLLAVAAHARGTSPVEVDASLRRLLCNDAFRVELIEWIRNTPRHGRPARGTT